MDSIADLLIRIKNSTLAKKRTITLPYSKEKESLANLLKKEGYLEKIESSQGKKRDLMLTLIFGKEIEVKRISKPGKRVYIKAKDINILRRGIGIVIISTPKGFMTGSECIKSNLGGEVVCKII